MKIMRNIYYKLETYVKFFILQLSISFIFCENALNTLKTYEYTVKIFKFDIILYLFIIAVITIRKLILYFIRGYPS